MQPVQLTPDESERLAMLHALGILDTPNEAVFDRITSLVARVLNVPIALISLIDAERQWFKSKFGISGSETPREYSFCSHAILENSAFIVTDATRDARFADNPFVVDAPNVRFYAGIPIRTAGGLALGTLCAIDDKPRTLSADELQMLNDLAYLVAKEFQFREALALSHYNLKTSQDIAAVSELRFRAIFDKAAVGIALVAPSGHWLSVNDELCQMVGYSKDELTILTLQDITHPDDLGFELGLLSQLANGEIDRYQLEKRYVRKDGQSLWIKLSVTPQFNLTGQVEYFVAIVSNIQAIKEAEMALTSLRNSLEERVLERTQQLSASNDMLSITMVQQQKSEQELRKRELELRMVIDNANDAYICIDQTGVVTAWNRQAEETFGWHSQEAIGQKIDSLIIPKTMHSGHDAGMQRYLATGQAAVIGKRIELPAVCRDGTIIPVEVRINALEIDGQTIFSAFLHDISDRKQQEAMRDHEATHDALTGLPNRRVFMDRLPLAMARTARSKQPLAVLFIDLDGFKAVNDQHGHDAGDALLREVAQRLNAAVRNSDTVVRMAGDEFTVILESMTVGLLDATLVAEKILETLSKPVLLNPGMHSKLAAADLIVSISASIGIALYEAGCIDTAEQLLKAADTAMYQAKRSGKKQISISF